MSVYLSNIELMVPCLYDSGVKLVHVILLYGFKGKDMYDGYRNKETVCVTLCSLMSLLALMSALYTVLDEECTCKHDFPTALWKD